MTKTQQVISKLHTLYTVTGVTVNHGTFCDFVTATINTTRVMLIVGSLNSVDEICAPKYVFK